MIGAHKVGLCSYHGDPCFKAYYALHAGAGAEGRVYSRTISSWCTFGGNHKQIADAVSHAAIVVESGIGYPGGGYAPYRVFESYAIMHAYHGQSKVSHASNNFWYDVVIPNAFDLDQFTFSEKKEDYFLFLGRVNEGKGAHIARQIAEATKTKLIVAGVGNASIFDGCLYSTLAGAVNPEQRADLLSKAKAVLCPSTFLEPFCGVQIEAMLSGTPVISSDWGAFAEYNKQGITGFRCRTFSDFIRATESLGSLYPYKIRDHALHCTLPSVAPLYDKYFKSVQDIYTGKGWYQESNK